MPAVPAAFGFVFAALGGVCLGWVLAGSSAEPATGPDLGLTAAPASAGAPSLTGVARTAPKASAAPTAEPGAPRPRVQVAVPEEVMPVFTLAGRELPEGRGPDILRALAMLHAALGNAESYEAMVARGLEAGADSSELLQLVELLPVDKRLASLDRLLAGPYVERPVGVVQHARLLAGAGAKERAIGVLSAALESALSSDVAVELITLDPLGSAARILNHPGLEAAEPDLLEGLATAWMGAGHHDIAWPLLERISAQGRVPDRVLEGLLASDPKQGLDVLSRLMASRRDEASLWAWLGRMRDGASDVGGAFDAYHQAAIKGAGVKALHGMLKADPKRAFEVARTLDLSGLRGEDRSVIAVLALHAGATQEAFDAIAQGLEEAPAEYSLLNAIARADPARAASVLGQRLAGYQGEDKDEVVGAYANALRLAGRSAEARAAYNEALALDPGDAEWIGGLARLDPARAQEALERERAASSGEEWWQLAQANVLMHAGRRAEALAIYNRFENDAGAASGLGLHDPAEGRRRLEAMLARQPNDDDTWVALGEMERELGNLPAARAAFEQAVRLEPHNLWNVVRWRQVTQSAATAPVPPPAR
jgi:tetratricopeptide (TPR) repeat protein